MTMMMRMMVSMSNTMLTLCSKTVSMRTQPVVSVALIAVAADHCTAILTRLISVASLSIVLPTKVRPTTVSSTHTILTTCLAQKEVEVTSLTALQAWLELTSEANSNQLRLKQLQRLLPRVSVSRSARAREELLVILSSMRASAAQV